MTTVAPSPASLMPEPQRRIMSEDTGLGCGNFLDRALALHPDPDAPFLFTDPDSERDFLAPAYGLTGLRDTRERLAGWYARRGVRPGDPVGVHLAEGFGSFLHYLALTRLGAIPVLVNGRMPGPVASEYVTRVGVVGLVADTEQMARLREHGGADAVSGFVVEHGRLWAEAADGDGPDTPPYEHDDADLVMLCHSSGTTGPPKATSFAHRQFFLGKRGRLLNFLQSPDERMLSALPQSHSAGISYLMTATMLGLPTMVMAATDGASVNAGMRRFRPTMVPAFPQTYADLAEIGPDPEGTGDLHTWFNTGDSAHEAHVRVLVGCGRRREGGVELPGSRFVDGLGSSEMGMALFRKVSVPETTAYERFVGEPIEVVEDVRVLGDDDRPVGPGEPGRLAVLTPTVTPGYWGNPEATQASFCDGYWLTGDVVRREPDGFYHLDRVSDVIRTAAGPVYSLPVEEVLLTATSAVTDGAVVAATARRGAGDIPLAVVRTGGPDADAQEILRVTNEALQAAGEPRIAELLIASDDDDLPVGPTGKVLKRQLRERFADPASRARAALDDQRSNS